VGDAASPSFKSPPHAPHRLRLVHLTRRTEFSPYTSRSYQTIPCTQPPGNSAPILLRCLQVSDAAQTSDEARRRVGKSHREAKQLIVLDYVLVPAARDQIAAVRAGEASKIKNPHSGA